MSQKRELFEAFLKKKGIHVPIVQAIKPRAITTPCPLSFTQEQLWLLDQLEPANPAYNIPTVLRLEGELQLERLQRSFAEVVRRQESLRTTFAVTRDGEPVQVIAPQLSLALPVIDLAQQEVARKENEAQRLLRRWTKIPFDLQSGPLFRVMVLRLGPQEHILALCLHHIIADGWSMGILLDELAHLYSRDASSAMEDLAVQYADVALWQREQMQGQRLEQEIAYWRKQLTPPPILLDLPIDRPRPQNQSFSGAAIAFTVDAEVAQALERLGRQVESTLFTVLLAAFEVLLFQYTGQSDLALATPVAGRTRSEFERIIGFFIKTLVLRTNLDAHVTFKTLVQDVHNAVLDAHAHQDFPVEKALEAVGLKRDTSRLSIIQVAFAFQNLAAPMRHMADLTLRPVSLPHEVAKVDLSLVMWEAEQGLTGVFEYATEIFDASTIELMTTDFRRLLSWLVKNPDLAINVVPMSILRLPQRGKELSQGLIEQTNLTKNQLLVWMGQQLQPDIPLYNTLGILRLPFAVDSDRFRAAFDCLVHSCDAMRTVIIEQDGVPYQQVLPQVSWVWQELDFSASPDPEIALQQWLQQRYRQCFQLDQCLFEMAFIKLASHSFVWYLKTHHIVTDGWSSSILAQHQSKLYELAIAGALPSLLPMPSYQQYTQDEYAYRQSVRYHETDEYWKRVLMALPDTPSFYGKRAHHNLFRARRVSRELGSARTEHIMEMARQLAGEGKPVEPVVFALSAAMLCTYLYRQSGQRDLAIGVPFHNRRWRSSKEVIGLVMETLPLHISLDPQESFFMLVRKVTKQLSEIMRRSPYALANPPYKKAYDVVLNYHNTPFVQFAGHTVRMELLFNGFASETLNVLIYDFANTGNLILDVRFHEELFTPQQCEQTLQHFMHLFDIVVQEPERKIGDIGLLTDAEEREFLHTSRQHTAIERRSQTLVGLFEEQMWRTPTRQAIRWKNESITYQQWHRRANQLANYLRSKGVGPEVRVGLCMERGFDVLIGLLGILKAGGVYVPLDPDYPSERLLYVLADADVAVLLTQEHLLTRLASYRGMVITSQIREMQQQSEQAPVLNLYAENAAYIVYTSGSTGKPKGVVVSHRSIVNAYYGWEEAYGLRRQEQMRHLQMANVAFDVFTGDIVRALGSGGQLILCPYEVLLQPEQLSALLIREQVTHAEFVPTVLRAMARSLSGQSTPLPAMQCLVVGSESWVGQEYAAWKKLGNDQMRLINSYGTTEATVDTCYFENDVGQTALVEQANVPIGYPFAGMDVYVLDQDLHIVPKGVIGEIYIAGEGLARGYYKLPGLTAERFIPSPFSQKGGERLYRTGDLACYGEEKAIEYRGRNDRQVKVRGHRIELGEIEAVLRGHEGVHYAMVELDSAGRIVAYVLLDQDEHMPYQQWRQYCRARLPDSMVPTVIVPLSHLPLLPNGKIDRKALPDPRTFEASPRVTSARSVTEKKLLAMWKEVLAVDTVGVDDDFFELGGHSLLATQIMARVRSVFHVDLSLRVLFEAPTITTLGAFIDERIAVEHAGMSISPVPRDKALPLSFMQEQLWLLDQLEPGTSAYNVPTAFRLHGALNIKALQWSFNEIIRRQESLRTTFVLSPTGEPGQVIVPRLALQMPLIDFTQQDEALSQKLLNQWIQMPFDLQQGPLFRVLLMRLGQQEHILALCLHHIVADGWSMGILLDELKYLYRFWQGEPTLPLADLPIQYADIAAWQRDQLRGQSLERELLYWREQLLPPPPLLNLPIDRPRPQKQSFRGALVHFVIQSELKKALEQLARHTGSTLFMVLLAAFDVLLFKYTGQSDIAVATPIAGRNTVETERLIGFFIKTLVLRTTLADDSTFVDLLQKVRQRVLDAFEHQEVPVEKVLELLKWKRDSSRLSIVQASFALQNFAIGSQEMADLILQPVQVPHKIAKLDLSLVMWEGEQELGASFEYATDLFDRSTITRMVAHFLELLKGITAHPGDRVADITPFLWQMRPSLQRSHDRLEMLDDLYNRSNLTRNQLVIWLGQQLQPDEPLYSPGCLCVFAKPIDPHLFEQALQVLIDSSDALRTVIDDQDGIPWQRVLPSLPVDMQQVDLSHELEPMVAVHEWVLTQHQRQRFHDRLFKVAFIRLKDRSACFLHMHHLITDAWSFVLIGRHLSYLYSAACEGRLPTHIELPTFQAYAQMERATRTTARYLVTERYWKSKLKKVPEAVTFYGKAVNKRGTTVRRLTYELGQQRTERLRAFASQMRMAAKTADSALFTLFASALFIYLHRQSKQDFLSMAVPLHNRRGKGAKETIGSFMEALPIFVRIEEQDTVRSLMDKVARETFETMRYGHYAVGNSLQRQLYDVLFNYQVASFSDFGGSQVELEMIDGYHSNESILMQVYDFVGSGQLVLDLGFHEEVFEPWQQQQSLKHLLHLFDIMLEDPDRPLNQISLLTRQEWLQVTEGWNRTQASLPAQQFIEAFEKQAALSKDDVAVLCGRDSLTYRELNLRADKLACKLSASGVGPETRIGLYMQRSIDMVVAILAVFKVGSAYVPLDPAYPSERIAYICEDADLFMLLADVDAIPATPIPVLSLTPRWWTMPDFADHCRVRFDAHRDQLAYVIYTSGSTGRPKGAMVTQDGMLNHLYAKIETLQLQKGDAVAQTASHCFDISIWQFLAALLVGGQVHIYADDRAHDPEALLACVIADNISMLELVPSMLRAMLDSIEQTSTTVVWPLRWLLVTGEAFPADVALRWQQQYPYVHVLNAYGPTECADDVAHAFVEGPVRSVETSIPIGRPIINTQLYILDQHLLPVPIGLPGEIYVGGRGVGRGYLKQPARTAQSFLPDPFSEEYGSRLYRTGDIGRYLGDGEIEFLARSDQQVKVRGHRIELGEIESVLLQHALVVQAVVRLWEPAQLVAYVVLDVCEPIETTSLVSTLLLHCQQRLPNSMVPATIVPLTALPTTANGKVDRKALPAPNFMEGKHAQVPARNALEQQLVQIWQEVLGISQVGVTDNFFELGGHSLLAIQIKAQVYKHMGQTISLISLYQNATIEQLAQVLRQHTSPSASSHLVVLQPRGERRPFFALPPLSGQAVSYLRLAHHLGSDQPFLSIQSPEMMDGSDVPVDIGQMAAQYVTEIRAYQPQGPYLLGGWSFGGIVAFEMAQQLLQQGQEVALLALLDSRPFVRTQQHVDDVLVVAAMAREIAFQQGKDFPISFTSLQKIDPALRVDAILARVKAAGIEFPTDQDVLQRFLRAYRMRQEALTRYKPQIYPGRITLFTATDIDSEYMHYLREIEGRQVHSPHQEDPTYGWAKLSSMTVDVHEVPGFHAVICSEPHVQVLAHRLRQCIDRVHTPSL